MQFSEQCSHPRIRQLINNFGESSFNVGFCKLLKTTVWQCWTTKHTLANHKYTSRISRNILLTASHCYLYNRFSSIPFKLMKCFLCWIVWHSLIQLNRSRSFDSVDEDYVSKISTFESHSNRLNLMWIERVFPKPVTKTSFIRRSWKTQTKMVSVCLMATLPFWFFFQLKFSVCLTESSANKWNEKHYFQISNDVSSWCSARDSSVLFYA